MNIPKGHLSLMPYLILTRANEFLEFVNKVFNAIEQSIEFRDDGIIRHAEIKIFDSVVMLAQATKEFPNKSAGIFIYVEDVDSIYTAAMRENSIILCLPKKKNMATPLDLKILLKINGGLFRLIFKHLIFKNETISTFNFYIFCQFTEFAFTDFN